MVGRYIKYDKSGVEECQRLLNEAYDELNDVLGSVDNFISVVRQVDKEDLYQEDTNWFQDTLGEWFSRTFVKFDWRNAYKTFCGYLDSLSTENKNTKTSELNAELQPLKNSVQGLITLVEEFDMSTGFNLANEYTGKSSNVRIEQSGDSSVIYYLDENGAEITLSQLLNCFYTYSGMAISAQLEGFLRASQEGIPFDAEYQMGLLNQVNGTVDSLRDVGAFGVASAADIVNLHDSLALYDGNFHSLLNIDSNGNLVNNVGGNWTSNMEAGSISLLEYPLAEYVNKNRLLDDTELPPGDVENPGEEIPEEDINVGPTTETEEGTKNTDEEPTDIKKGPTGIDETIENPVIETVPGEGEGEDPEVIPGEGEEIPGEGEEPSSGPKIDLEDYGAVSEFKGMLPEMEYDYDDLARQMFEGMSEDELMAFREVSINKATTLIDSNDVSGIANGLAEYGYSDRDISNFVDVNNNIIKNPDAVVAAYVAGDQNNYMASMANNMAKNDGVTNFTSSHGSNASYSNHKNGSVNANIANMHDDEEVEESSKKYHQAKNHYKQKSEEVNEAAEEANEALKEVKEIPQKYGEDTSKWTDEQVQEYKDAQENYEAAKENYENKVDEYNQAEQEYNEARNDYDEAKENFEEKIKEDVRANEEFYESQPKDEVEVGVGDDSLVEEVTGNGEPSTDTGATTEPEVESGSGAEENANNVNTETVEGTRNDDGTVSASDDGLLSAIGGGGDAPADVASAPEMTTGSEGTTAASENGLATGDTGATTEEVVNPTGETNTEPQNGIDDLRNGMDTPDVETSGMPSTTTSPMEPASESGIITEGNTPELGDVGATNPIESTVGTVETPGENPGNNTNNGPELITENDTNNAAIAAQISAEEAQRIEKSKTEGGADVEIPSQPTPTVQTASVKQGFNTDAGVSVESSGNQNVVTVGDDALMNAITTE